MLFLAAAGLFGLRYGFERRLNLQKPLARILFDAFGGSFEQRAASNAKKSSRKPWDQTPATISLDDPNPSQLEKLEEAPDSVIKTVDDVDPDNQNAQQPGGNAKGKSDGKQAEGERAEDGAEQSETAQGSSTSKDADQAGAKQGDSQSGKQSPNSNGDNGSLASKIKDAMQNLMASMKPQNNGQSQQQQGGKNSGQEKSQQAKGGQKSAAGKGQKKSGEQNAESQEGRATTIPTAARRGRQKQRQKFRPAGKSQSGQRHRQAGWREGRAPSRATRGHGKDQRDYRETLGERERRSDSGSELLEAANPHPVLGK